MSEQVDEEPPASGGWSPDDGVATTERISSSSTPRARESVRETAPDVVVAIPAYDEADTVADVVAAALPHADEVLVVDDGSSDDTAGRAAAAGATVIPHRTNRGYGAALKTAFRATHERGADHLVVLDADGQHDPATIPDLVDAQRETGAGLVVGSRFLPDADTSLPPYRRFGVGVVNVAANAGLRLAHGTGRISDTQSGFRSYDEATVATLARDPELGDGMAVSLDVLFRVAAAGHEVAEVPADVTYDVAEPSTHNPVRHGVVLLYSVFVNACSARPWKLLGLPGASLLLLGVVAAIGALPVLAALTPVIVLPLVVAGTVLSGVAVLLGWRPSNG